MRCMLIASAVPGAAVARRCCSRDHLVQREPRPAELLGHEQREIPLVAQLGEVLVEEAVLAVVHRRPLAEPFEQILRQVSLGQLSMPHFSVAHSLSDRWFSS